MRRNKDISIDAYTQAVEEYQRLWATLDHNLYRVCRENPDHVRPDGIRAIDQLDHLRSWHGSMQCFEIPSDADESYSYYLMHVAAHYQQLRDRGVAISIRHLDFCVLSSSIS